MDNATYELVVFDGDETLIDGDIIDALAEYAGVTERVQQVKVEVWENGLDAMDALAEDIFPLFEGISVAEVDHLVESLSFAPGARTVGQNVTCQTAIFTALAPLATHIAAELDFDHWRANTPLVEDGVLTGELEGEIIEHGKGPVLDALVADLGISHDQVIAIGDGPHDIPLFERAGFSVGMNPRGAVRDVPDVATTEQDFTQIIPELISRGVLDPSYGDQLAGVNGESESNP